MAQEFAAERSKDLNSAASGRCNGREAHLLRQLGHIVPIQGKGGAQNATECLARSPSRGYSGYSIA